ncbi:DNA adenine methylase [Lacipirellula parvula]|uniref:site-specific DNA-methyltransferase (adenine-specific) n=1 Tax=Lacipirellula parvula TaxID=2650471 RepID=A0A5K7XC94_9BACT|nr:DNA adenine methylase [Lacipirellula parvula]BBO34440.1 type II, N-methyl DNA methyltransferase [Lacipirellula parvula]
MKLRPPVKWHGGKHYLASRIIELFPEHRIYLEPFGGAASVLLNKKPVDVEAYNDLDPRINRLFRVLRDEGDRFAAKLAFTPYSEAEFEACQEYSASASDLDMAVCDFVRWRQSFGGQGKTWSCTTTRARGGIAGDVNAWWSAIEMLPEIIARLQCIQILHRPAIEAINKFDYPEGLIYCDPPYVHATRAKGSRAIYEFEMTDQDHRDLAAVLMRCRSKVVLSGYPSELYEELYGDWRSVDFDIANHAAGGNSKRRMFERVWMNF